MPFRRRKFKRKFARRSTRFRRFRRRRRSAVVNTPELKVEDTTQAALNASTSSAALVRLIDMDQGIGSAQRIGNVVRLMSLSVTIHVFFDQAAIEEEVWHRVAVMIDLQTEAATLPTPAAIYEASTDPQSFREKATAGRFRSLFSRSFMMDKRNRQTKVIKMTKRFPLGLKVRFSGATGADFQKNLVFFIGQADTVIGTATTYNLLVRTRFYDA